jgi:hypothetical protein
MQLLFILLAIIGLTMLFFGGKWMLQIIRSKTMAELTVFQNEQEMTIAKPGLYSVSSVVPHMLASISVNFSITHNGHTVDGKWTTMRARFMHRGNFAKEFYQFEVTQPGKYLITIKEPIVPRDTLIVKESMPNLKRIAAIILLVLGFNLGGWGIILSCNPHIFIR